MGMARLLVPGWNNPTVSQEVKSGQVNKTEEIDNKTTMKHVFSSCQIISKPATEENASLMNINDDTAISNEDESFLTKSSIPNTMERPQTLNRLSPEQAVSDLVNNICQTKSLTPKT